MQKKISISTDDGHVIYGTQNLTQEKSDKLIIFVHGFTGHQDEHIFFNAAKFFNSHNYDAFRFDLYSAEKDGRHFRDTTISIHATDTTTIIEHFKNQYKKIYLVGHSFGGTTLLLAHTAPVSALVFWDASYIDWKVEEEDFQYNPVLDQYVIKDRIDYLAGKPYIEELKHFPDCGELVSGVHMPLKFITAGDNGNDSGGQKYLRKANEPKELVNIATADHCFNGFEEEARLFEETLLWLERY